MSDKERMEAELDMEKGVTRGDLLGWEVEQLAMPHDVKVMVRGKDE